MTAIIAAKIYAACAALPITMQIALAFGAPLGRFANGGLHPGVLPPVWRGLAVMQGALLIAMTASVLAKATVISVQVPSGAFGIALGLTVLTLIANALSPSRPERLLWGPVTAVMVIAVLRVAFE
ncbi:hypothetical protein [Thalassovita sp.]|uniref:hypothetical protein n=1 Tax=Thalassovita sp. TaxID=1979401 RepID=UPI0028810572|nr:hypothetical protein [Thalassovita sp.]MDF1804281.1 hypothetical protein [Thalassovita sp.]